nr:MAG: wsv277-like protein [Chiromantes dehaani nimavirus]
MEFVEETEVLTPAVTAELSSENITPNKRKRRLISNCDDTADDEVLPETIPKRPCKNTTHSSENITQQLLDTTTRVLSETTAKKARKNAPGKIDSTNNSFRYWKVEVEDSGDSSILEAVNNNITISKVLPVSPTSIGLKFVKSMTCQQVRAIVKDYQCGDITRMECSAFRKLDNSRKKTDNDESSTSDKPSRPRIYPTNSYYTFTTVGETFAEKVANIKKILRMSPVKKPFPSGDDDAQHVSPRGIKDIHFFTIDLTHGCFTVRNKMKVEEPKDEGKQPSLFVDEFDLAKYYEGLFTDIEKIGHDKYMALILQRNMRRHIKSWICICPYYAKDGVPPADDIVIKKGISAYRLFDNGMSVFQFESQRSAITPADAAEAMGAMHKSLCFQSSGNIVRKLLVDSSNNNTLLASMGDLTYRSKWRNNDKRPTKCVKFYSIAEDKKITNQDILDLVNTEKMFLGIHFREDNMAYGVAKKSGKKKIVPDTIKLSDDSKIRFTAITLNEFNTKKNVRGMQCFNTWRKGPKVTTFNNIPSTAFSFNDLTEESVKKIMFQKKVNLLKAVKNKEVEDSYHGVIKTITSVKGCNLLKGCNLNGKISPEGKSSFGYKLETLEKENNHLAIDFSRKKEKATTSNKEEHKIDTTENQEQEKNDEEEPYEEL